VEKAGITSGAARLKEGEGRQRTGAVLPGCLKRCCSSLRDSPFALLAAVLIFDAARRIQGVMCWVLILISRPTKARMLQPFSASEQTPVRVVN
jgi:hypothetical protein